MIRLKTKLPGPKSLELMKARESEVARGPFHSSPIFISKAKGALVEDVDGNQLIDLASGIGVVNIGHSPERIVQAIQEQAERYIHSSFNVIPYESYVKLCANLNRAVPGNFKKKSFLANSGAEAVENAIKIARAYTKRPNVFCFEHAFHGRTFFAMALTAKEKPYKAGFGPFQEGVFRAPFPYAYRWPTSHDPEVVARECFSDFQKLVDKAGKDTVAAVIIEPVLGEGGFIVAPPTFLKLLRDYCTSNQIVLIIDEIQSGFGRTGKMFASEALGVEPDLMTTAKCLGGGTVISAVTGRAEMMDAPEVGGIGGTFGGNPLSCAAANAVFESFEKDDILAKANRTAEVISKRFEAWKRFPTIGEARGLGAMRAIELVKESKSKEPNPELAKKLVTYCYERGVIILSCGTYGNVIRFLMPLVIEPAELNEALDVVEKGLSDLS